MLTLTFGFGAMVILWHLDKLSEVQIRTMAVNNAKLYSQTLLEFRHLYTSEVVLPAINSGLEASHEYRSKKNAIPLPITLNQLLNKRLKKNNSGLSSQFYSPSPFPWREESGGLIDKFAHRAWEALQNNPSSAYYTFEELDGQVTLRYASADIMKNGCINCHNSHPQSPKSDWKAGDIAGVLEINSRIESSISLANNMLKDTFLLLTGLLLGALVGIGFVIKKFRTHSSKSNAIAKETSISNARLAQEMKIRQLAEENLVKLTYTDALTDIANRRKFNEKINKEWERALRSHSPLSVIMLDIDYFKDYNDNYGHQTGDNALIMVAQILKQSHLRSSDLVARYGGEEFVILLPDTDLIGALQVAETVRSKIEQSEIIHDYSKVANVITVSAGVSTMVPTPSDDMNALVKYADQSLYAAKESGRNCVK